jgi:hypothetical protein
MDENLGYSLDFTILIPFEQHFNNDRAGFSVTVVGNDLLGIEIGFWKDLVFAQNGPPNLFTRGESVNLTHPTTNFGSYSLLFSAQNYSLYSNKEFLLGGQLRNYSSWISPYVVNVRFF